MRYYVAGLVQKYFNKKLDEGHHELVFGLSHHWGSLQGLGKQPGFYLAAVAGPQSNRTLGVHTNLRPTTLKIESYRSQGNRLVLASGFFLLHYSYVRQSQAR
jgi:hypothetical protein